MASEECSLDDLLRRLQDFVNGDVSAQDFCRFFENAWNFEVNREAIPAGHRVVLNHLFDEVVFFSPLPRETWGYPGYRDEREILSAAKDVLQKIKPA